MEANSDFLIQLFLCSFCTGNGVLLLPSVVSETCFHSKKYAGYILNILLLRPEIHLIQSGNKYETFMLHTLSKHTKTDTSD